MKVDNRIVFGVIGAAAVAIFFWGKSCERKEWVAKGTKIDTTYLKPDTIRTTVTKEVLKPIGVVKWMPSGVIIDTVIVEKPNSSDTIGTYLDYYRTYAYEYTERLGPAVISISDTISQNMFMGRSVTAIFDSVPIVTKTLLIQQPKKVVLYASLSALGNSNDLLYGFGGGLALKGLNDKIYGIEAKYLKGGSLYYEGKIMFPIRLKKK